MSREPGQGDGQGFRNRQRSPEELIAVLAGLADGSGNPEPRSPGGARRRRESAPEAPPQAAGPAPVTPLVELAPRPAADPPAPVIDVPVPQPVAPRDAVAGPRVRSRVSGRIEAQARGRRASSRVGLQGRGRRARGTSSLARGRALTAVPVILMVLVVAIVALTSGGGAPPPARGPVGATAAHVAATAPASAPAGTATSPATPAPAAKAPAPTARSHQPARHPAKAAHRGGGSPHALASTPAASASGPATSSSSHPAIAPARRVYRYAPPPTPASAGTSLGGSALRTLSHRRAGHAHHKR